MKLLSIVIPVYNVESYLKKCLDSVICLEPGLQDQYEIVAVNDGSTDSSATILDDYKKNCPELIRVITKQNGGLGSARNAAIPVSEGKYVIFLDSDDWLSENAVPEMLEVCSKNTFDICFFGMQEVTEEGIVLETVEGANETGPFTLDSNPEILLCRMNACNKIFRRSLFTDNNIYFPDRVWYEDVFTTPKLYTKAGPMIRADAVWYNYLRHNGSIMNNKHIARNLEIIDAVDTMNSYYKKKGLFEKYHDQLEYATIYNELITATVRINRINPVCPEQDRLLEYFLKQFPNYRNNPYVRKMGIKYTVLTYLIVKKMRPVLRLVILGNDIAHHIPFLDAILTKLLG